MGSVECKGDETYYGGEIPDEISADVGLKRGDLIARYVVLDLLGQGGMAMVYRAYDTTLDRTVALKLVRADRAQSIGQDVVRKEALQLAKLSHPNIVTIFDVDQLPDGRIFMAMECVTGVSAKTWAEKPRDWKAVLRLYRQAAKGLSAAHEIGMTHGDFKPANLLLGDKGRVRVVDFGLARGGASMLFLEDPELSETITGAQPIPNSTTDLKTTEEGHPSAPAFGTPGYMSPEQCRGEGPSSASDQFSFAVALYETLYGERPYPKVVTVCPAESDWEIAQPSAESRVPLKVRKAVLRALSRNPAQRYSSMADFSNVLEALEDSKRKTYWFAALLLLVATLIAFFQHRNSAVENACKASYAEAEELWGEKRQHEIREIFKKTGYPGALEVFARMNKPLQSYAVSWAQGWEGACIAYKRDGVDSDKLYDLKRRCLRARKNALEGTITAFHRADAKTVEKSIEIAYSLPSVEQCDDENFLLSEVRPPATLVARDAVESARADLAVARAQVIGGQHENAAEIARAALSVAKEYRYAPLESEAAIVLGDSHPLGVAEAEASYHRAFYAAAEANDRQLLFEAAHRLRTNANNLMSRESERHWAVFLQRLVAGMGATPVQRAESLLAQIGVAILDRDYVKAKDVGNSIQQLADEILTTKPLRAANLLNSLANNLGEIPGKNSLKLYERVLELRTTILGSDHQDVMVVKLNTGLEYQEYGFYDKALEYQETVASYCEGRRSVMCALNQGNKGETLLWQGRYDDAVKNLTASIEMMRQLVGEESELALMFHRIQVDALVLGGRYVQAKTQAERQLEFYKKNPADDGFRASLQGALGRVLWFQGDRRTGTEVMEAALADLKEDASDQLQVFLFLDLARAHYEAGDTKRADQLVEQVRDRLHRHGRSELMVRLERFRSRATR